MPRKSQVSLKRGRVARDFRMTKNGQGENGTPVWNVTISRALREGNFFRKSTGFKQDDGLFQKKSMQKTQINKSTVPTTNSPIPTTALT